MVTAVGYPVLVRAFRLALTVDGLKPHTIQSYVRVVERFAAHVGGRDPDSITAADIRDFVAALQLKLAAKTVNEAQLALRRFFRFLVIEREIQNDPSATMKLVRYRVDPQPTYSESEISQLLAACDTGTRQGLRDRAIVTVLFDTGVRERELVSMGLPDWDSRTLRVDGKGGIRQVYLGTTTALQAVERYVRRWGIADGKLWRGKKGALTGSGILQLVRRLCKRAHVEDKGVHAFRRASAAQMKRLGMNVSDILEVMGWKDVTMLRRYTAAVAGVIQELQKVPARQKDPAIPLVITIGSIQGGTARNIIADTVTMKGTVRTMSEEVRALAHKRIRDLSVNLARAHGADAKVEITTGEPVLVNDDAMVDLIREAVKDVVGSEKVFSAEPWTAADDFAFYCEVKPSVYFRLGVGNRAKGIDRGLLGQSSGRSYGRKMYAALAAQKNYLSLYLMNVYADKETERWFVERYRAIGKKLNMGKSCVRFKRVDDLPIDLIGDAIARTPVAEFIMHYEASRRRT